MIRLVQVHQVKQHSSLEDLEGGHEAIQEQQPYQDKARLQDFLSAKWEN